MRKFSVRSLHSSNLTQVAVLLPANCAAKQQSQQPSQIATIKQVMPVTTRGSPPPTNKRKLPQGRPPLPKPAKGGKGKAKDKPKKKDASKKAPAKVAAAAKTAVAEVDGKVYVKAEAELTTGGNYTEEEDLYLCKAWVSVSTDPIKGANQKGETFWKSVHEKMYLIYSEEAEVVCLTKRSWESVKNRFQKTIHPTVQKFNSYYKQAVEKNESGWTKEMYMEAAGKVWLQMEGRPYKFSIVTRVLHQAPKFNPMIDEEDDDGKPKAKIMGSNLERPIGAKKAKKQRAIEALGDGSMESIQVMEAMARSSADMADTMAKRQRHDSWSKRAELYMKMGQEDKAMEMLSRMEEDEKKVPPVPVNITVANQDEKDDVSTSDEAQQNNTGTPENVLDDGDEGDTKPGDGDDKDSDQSTHTSQPSDDSRLVKKRINRK